MKTLTAAIISRWKLHSMFFISAEPNMKKPTELPRILDRLKINVLGKTIGILQIRVKLPEHRGGLFLVGI